MEKDIPALRPVVLSSLLVVCGLLSGCGFLDGPDPVRCEGPSSSLHIILKDNLSNTAICGASVDATNDGKAFKAIEYPTYSTGATTECRGHYFIIDGSGYFDLSITAETYRPISSRVYVRSTECGPQTRLLDLSMEKE